MGLTKTKVLSFLLIVLALSSGGCSTSNQPEPTETIIQTDIPTPNATLTPTNIPTPSPTLTPTVTATPHYDIGSIQIRPVDGMTMLYVPAGEFVMGSLDGDLDEQPIHTVYLDAYWIDSTEITNSMYELCVEAGVCTLPSKTVSIWKRQYYGSTEFSNYPVNYIAWAQADTYCRWAGGQLPTEAEWEKAARGTDGRKYPWGDDFFKMNLVYGFSGRIITSDNPGAIFTKAAGSYMEGASPYRAMDMAGNVWEWVADWYAEGYYSVSLGSNPTGPDTGESHVLRGGSWHDDSKSARSANRESGAIISQGDTIGFRCAVSP
jgi:formylglycine-generating enzyme required for sulfatase activity